MSERRLLFVHHDTEKVSSKFGYWVLNKMLCCFGRRFFSYLHPNNGIVCVHQENLIIELQTFYFAGDGMLSLKRHHEARSQNREKRLLASSCLPVCPSTRPHRNRIQLGGFHEIWYWSSFRKTAEKIQVSLKSDKDNGYFTWRPIYVFGHTSLDSQRMKMLQAEVVQKLKKHILYSIIFFENLSVKETMWKNIVECDRPQMAIWRMCIACWILKATRTHSEYVILVAFPMLQLLHGRPSMFRYTHIACLVLI